MFFKPLSLEKLFFFSHCEWQAKNHMHAYCMVAIFPVLWIWSTVFKYKLSIRRKPCDISLYMSQRHIFMVGLLIYRPTHRRHSPLNGEAGRCRSVAVPFISPILHHVRGDDVTEFKISIVRKLTDWLSFRNAVCAVEHCLLNTEMMYKWHLMYALVNSLYQQSYVYTKYLISVVYTMCRPTVQLNCSF